MHDHVRTGPNLRRDLLTVAASLLVAAAAFGSATAIRRSILDASYLRRRTLDSDPTILVSPGRDAMAIVSMEHAYGLADIAWLGVLGEIGRGSDADPVRVEREAYLTTDLDPKYELVYWASGVLLNSDLYDFTASDRVALRGRDACPESWRLVFLLGFNAYFGHGDPKTASNYWAEAARHDDAPKYMASLAARALFHAGQEKSAEQMLEEMIPILPEAQRPDAVMKLNLLRSEYRLRRFDAACEKFLADKGRRPIAAEELRVEGYVDEPPFDLLDSPIEFDKGTCVSRTEIVFIREAEAAERIGMMQRRAKQMKKGIFSDDEASDSRP